MAAALKAVAVSASAIVQAFNDLQTLKASLYATDEGPGPEWTREEESDWDAKCSALEDVIMQTPARKIEEVICRLLFLLPKLDEDRWVDSTLSQNGFQAVYASRGGLCPWAQQLAEAVHDLQRIGRAQ